MDFSRVDKYRDNTLFGVATSLASGMLLAFAAFTLKTALANQFILEFLLPLVLGFAGFVCMQIAFRTWHLSGAMPVISGSVVVVSNVLAISMLGEQITTVKGIAIGLIVVGVVLFVLTGKKGKK